MKKFFLGVTATLAGAVLVTLFVGLTGRISMRADILPSAFEKNIAMRLMDANVARIAPKVANPVQPTDQNLMSGASIYLKHCAVCHGDPSQPESRLAETLYPPPPQFIRDAPDMAENENYYIVSHGVRWTGMPGWKNVLADRKIWTVVTFLSHMDNLPPAAKSAFAPPADRPAAAPPTQSMKKMPKMKM
ncbi:MAG TPA: c-type cytochrome [Candidatus Dormibacteraeota bacterium]|nr:c-type cytochrome [Candidatus Dormibacteraeota bacterium]